MYEGRTKKIVKDAERAGFSGRTAAKFGRRVLYVTERAVFTLDGERLIPRETAPGTGLQPSARGGTPSTKWNSRRRSTAISTRRIRWPLPKPRAGSRA